MKNGVIKINAFQILDDIAKNHNVKAQAWAKAAFGKPIFSSRISELRKLHTQHETGEYGEKVGRVLSADKLKALLDGLKKIIGGDVVRKELIDKLAAVKTDMERNMILLMVADEKDQKAIRLFLEALVDKK